MVDASNSIYDFDWTSIFEWCMAGCESKNEHSKDTCWKEVGLPAPSLFNVLDVIIDIIGKTYMIIFFELV